jgi:KDO2-lipid IV(A) lauroyltransferase
MIRYRRTLVTENIRCAFPEMTNDEVRKTARQFYINFADFAVETLKALTISQKELHQRLAVDMDLFDRYFAQNQSVFILTSHMFNWEWLLQAYSISIRQPVHAGYQVIENGFFNRLMLKIRSRFGAIMHDRGHLLRDIIRTRDELKVFAVVADQRPIKGDNYHWSTFLNRDAAFFTSTETLSRKLNYSVVYVDIRRKSRGFYESKIIAFEDPPFKSRPFSITDQFIRAIEENIRACPSGYLWSHNRWKLKKPISAH